jgi:hypothetical protein
MALTSGSASFNIHDQSMWRKVRTTFPDDDTYREPSRGWEASGLEPTGSRVLTPFFTHFAVSTSSLQKNIGPMLWFPGFSEVGDASSFSL